MYVEHLKTPNNRGHDKVSYQFCISCFYPVLDSNPKNQTVFVLSDMHLWFLWIYPPRRSLPGVILWVGCGCWLAPSGTRLFKCCVSMAVYWPHNPWSIYLSIYLSIHLSIYLSIITRSWWYHGIQSSKIKGKGLCNYIYIHILIDVPWGGHAGVIVPRLHIWCRWGNPNKLSKTRHPGCFKLMWQPCGSGNVSTFLVTYIEIGFIHPPAIYSKMVNWKMYPLNLLIYQLTCYDICW